MMTESGKRWTGKRSTGKATGQATGKATGATGKATGNAQVASPQASENFDQSPQTFSNCTQDR